MCFGFFFSWFCFWRTFCHSNLCGALSHNGKESFIKVIDPKFPLNWIRALLCQFVANIFIILSNSVQQTDNKLNQLDNCRCQPYWKLQFPWKNCAVMKIVIRGDNGLKQLYKRGTKWTVFSQRVLHNMPP